MSFSVIRDKRLWLGMIISGFFLFFLLRKIDGPSLLAAFRSMDLRYLLPALLFTFLSYFMRAVRWKYLITPLKTTPSMGNLYRSTIIGYMANNLLPARLGEFVRAYALGARENINVSAVFGTLVVDRLLDGFTVLLMLAITLFTLRLPPGKHEIQRALVTGGYITVAVYAAVVIFLVLLKKQRSWTIRLLERVLIPFPPRLREKILSLTGSFLDGIGFANSGKRLLSLLLSSILIWTFATWPVHLVLKSFGIDLPITASMFIMVLLVFAVMVPAAPGYIGTYHFACFQGLTAFDIPAGKAMSIALIIHGLSFFPVIVAGLYYLWRDNLSLKDVSQKGVELE